MLHEGASRQCRDRPTTGDFNLKACAAAVSSGFIRIASAGKKKLVEMVMDSVMHEMSEAQRGALSMKLLCLTPLGDMGGGYFSCVWQFLGLVLLSCTTQYPRLSVTNSATAEYPISATARQ